MKRLICLCIGVLFISGCANFYCSRYPNNNYSPTVASALPIYNNFPPVPYEVIGEVGADGAPASSWSSIGRRMREYAAQIGGDAIVIQSQESPYVGSYNTPTTATTTSSAYGSAHGSGNYVYGQVHGQSQTVINPGSSIPMYGKSIRAIVIKFIANKENDIQRSGDTKEQGNSFIVFNEQSINNESGYVPSGWMGDYQAVKLDYNYAKNSHSGLYCQKWIYSGKKTNGQGWAGVYWQNPPNNWGNMNGGFDLSKFTKLNFWAKGERGGEVLVFGMGGIKGNYSDSSKAELPKITLTKEWKLHTVDLENNNLSKVIGGFFWIVNKVDNPDGCTFYLDDIVYE